jgi:hypothetical protein
MLDLRGGGLPGLGQSDACLSFVVCESHSVFFCSCRFLHPS